jgi:F-type H+-transporting ATPase subunit alpha
VTNGYLDDIPVNRIREWERGFHDYLHAQFPQIGQGIRKERVLTKELEADLKRAIAQYKEITSSTKDAPALARPAAAAAK